MCPNYIPAANFSLQRETRRDPSSFVQRFCDTASVRYLEPTSASSFGNSCIGDSGLERLRESLNVLLIESESLGATTTNEFTTNIKLVKTLSPAIEWLLQKVPLDQALTLQSINREEANFALTILRDISRAPVNLNHSPRVQILDILNCGLYLELLSTIARIVAHRTKLEDDLAQLMGKCSKIDTSPQTLQRLICGLTLNREGNRTYSTFVLVVWLKRLIAKTWDGQSILDRGSIACGSLEIVEALLTRDVDLPQDVWEELFTIPFINARIDAVQSAQSWLEALLEDDISGRHLFSWPCIFTRAEISTHFRLVNHLRMRYD